MSRSKEQHYNSAFYLRYWNFSTTLCLFDLEKENFYNSSKAEKIFKKKNLFRAPFLESLNMHPCFIDDVFQEIENEASKVMKDFFSKETIRSLDRSWIAWFIAIQRIRTLSFKELISTSTMLYYKNNLKNYYDDPSQLESLIKSLKINGAKKEFIEDLKSNHREAFETIFKDLELEGQSAKEHFVYFILLNLEQLFYLYLRADWVLFKIPPTVNDTFITSDNPVSAIKLNNDIRVHFFPLNPKNLLLLMLNDQHGDFEIYCEAGDIHEFNYLNLISSKRYIISGSNMQLKSFNETYREDWLKVKSMNKDHQEQYFNNNEYKKSSIPDLNSLSLNKKIEFEFFKKKELNAFLNRKI